MFENTGFSSGRNKQMQGFSLFLAGYRFHCINAGFTFYRCSRVSRTGSFSHQGQPHITSPAFPIHQSFTSPEASLSTGSTGSLSSQSNASPGLPICQSNTSPVTPLSQSSGIYLSQSNSQGLLHNQSNSPGLPHSQSNSTGLLHSQSNSPGLLCSQSNSPGLLHSQSISPGLLHSQSNSRGLIHSHPNTSPDVSLCQSTDSPRLQSGLDSSFSPHYSIPRHVSPPTFPVTFNQSWARVNFFRV